MDLFTNREILIMASVIGSLLLILIVLILSEILDRKKELKEENIENIDLEQTENVSEIANVQIEMNVEEPVVNNYQEVNVEVNNEVLKIETLDVETNKDNEPLIMEIEEPELTTQEKAKIELLKLEEELRNAKPVSLEDTLTNLEAIEEENAIISYQELLSNTKELDIVSADSGDEPITISEVFEMYETKEEPDVAKIEDAYHGVFSSSPYLSPINGVEGENLTEIQLENTANLEKLEKEIQKTNKFLNMLNELKKNLD